MQLHLVRIVTTAALFALPSAMFAASCESLTGLTLADTTITLAKSMPAGSFTPPESGRGRGGRGGGIADLPAFCEVHGVLKPTASSVIHFEVWLPESNWNGRLQTVGNGGLAGTIGYAAMATALRNGYATTSTDTGHTSAESREWMQDKDRLIDYSYRGLHLSTVDAKGIAAAYYGNGPQKSYYTGCSTGGKQGLMEAQRFPADFDGIVAGDAANFWTHQMADEIWAGVATSGDSALPQEKLALVQNAVLEQCDALDGVKDGLILDNRRCKFDPKKLLCKSGDGANCLTQAQESAVEKLYSGPINPRTHQPVYAGLYPGGELGWGRGGGMMVINRTNGSGVSSNDFTKYALFSNPEWNFRTFDFDKDLQTMDEKLASITNATDPNLEEFRRLGHKLLYYHGTSDPLIPAQNGINYYESVVAAQKGEDKTKTFFRVFLVPGLYHCNGGPGATAFGGGSQAPESQRDADHDVLKAVSRWVEQGTAPERIIATRYVDNSPAKGVAFQHPLCAWPLAARYKGTGDQNDAANFTCVK